MLQQRATFTLSCFVVFVLAPIYFFVRSAPASSPVDVADGTHGITPLSPGCISRGPIFSVRRAAINR